MGAVGVGSGSAAQVGGTLGSCGVASSLAAPSLTAHTRGLDVGAALSQGLLGSWAESSEWL